MTLPCLIPNLFDRSRADSAVDTFLNGRAKIVQSLLLFRFSLRPDYFGRIFADAASLSVVKHLTEVGCRLLAFLISANQLAEIVTSIAVLSVGQAFVDERFLIGIQRETDFTHDNGPL